MSRQIVILVAALAAGGVLAVSGAGAKPGMLVGIYDDAQVVSNPEKTFPLLRQLRVEVVRVTMRWGGKPGLSVAGRSRPAKPTDPADPAYSWAVYDRIVTEAAKYKIKVLFSILGTPGWANGGKRWNTAPKKALDLQRFALAAANRYSGTYEPPAPKVQQAGRVQQTALPAVRLWLAWNEPNNPVFLTPQFRKVGKNRYVVQSPRDYATICNAVYAGVHATKLAGEKVACGATGPRGNNNAHNLRPSLSPLVFLENLKRSGLRTFDAYAHHPYYTHPKEGPTTKPRKRTVTLANIGVLIKELTRFYGRKPLWITEYGFQTRPPDRLFGVSYSEQASYLKKAFAIARKNPRIEMMIWFLLRDEPGTAGWQSGFFTVSWKKKPSFAAFQRLPH